MTPGTHHLQLRQWRRTGMCGLVIAFPHPRSHHATNNVAADQTEDKVWPGWQKEPGYGRDRTSHNTHGGNAEGKLSHAPLLFLAWASKRPSRLSSRSRCCRSVFRASLSGSRNAAGIASMRSNNSRLRAMLRSMRRYRNWVRSMITGATASYGGTGKACRSCPRPVSPSTYPSTTTARLR